jgi:PAS domain S-box-containing protein
VSEEFAVQCIKAGVDDYILKDRLRRLPAAIHSALEKVRIDRDRKKILDKVIANEAMMKEAERLAHFGSWHTDIVSNTHIWSDETWRIFGYTPGEVDLSYELFLSHVHPEDVGRLREQMERTIVNLDSWEGEYRVIDKKGQVKYIDAKIVIRRDQTGAPITATGFNLDITARKTTANQLQKSQQEYKSLFDQNPDAVYSLDLNGNFINVNEGLIKLSGLSAEKLLQMDFNPFINTEDREKINSHFLAATKGSPQNYQARFVDAHGKTLILEITNMPIVVDNEIVGIHGIAKNITEKKQLQALLDKIHRLARIGGWEIDLIKNVYSWTPMTREILEVPDDFVVDLDSGLAFYKAGEDRDAIARAMDLAITEGKSFNLELKVITRLGNERWIRVIGDAELANGIPIRIYGSLQDINERKKAEEALNYSFKEKSTILESIADAFFAVNKDFQVTYWNNMAESMLDVQKSKALGENLSNIFSELLPLSFFDHLRKALNDNIPDTFQEYYQAKNTWIEVSVYPSASGLSVYIRDITDLKHYTQKIELQNERLREIGWIQSHKVRGPLARIMGLINLIDGSADRDLDNRKVLKMILDSAHELDGLIREIVRKTEELER